MATTVDPKRARNNVTFQSGGDTYQTSMANSACQGTLFTLMGFTNKKNEATAGAIILKRADLIENGLVVPMVAECRQGARSVYRKIYIPTSKLEETVKGAAGKTIGALQVLKVRGVKHRVII